MYRQCTTEKSTKRQQALAMALLEALQNRPVHEISISEICRKSGVSRKQFYQLFHDKTDVILWLIDQAIFDFGHSHLGSSAAVGWIYQFFAYWKEQHTLLDILKQNQMRMLLLERCLYHAIHVDSSALDTFHVDNMEYHQEMMMFYTSGILSLLFQWQDTGYARSIDQMCEMLRELVRKPPVDSL